MTSLHLFAGMRVRNFQEARAWYERLLGEPTFFPHDTEAVWTLAKDRSVYIVDPNGIRTELAELPSESLHRQAMERWR